MQFVLTKKCPAELSCYWNANFAYMAGMRIN